MITNLIMIFIQPMKHSWVGREKFFGMNILVQIEEKKYDFVTPKAKPFERNGVTFFWFFYRGKHLRAVQKKTGGWAVSSLKPQKETKQILPRIAA